MYVFGLEVPLIYILSASTLVYTGILVLMAIQIRNIYEKQFVVQDINIRLNRLEERVIGDGIQDKKLKNVIKKIKGRK